MKVNRIPIVGAVPLAAALLLSIFSNGAAMAADTKTIEIAGGPAGQALREFVAQTGMQLLFDYDSVNKLTTRAVSGELSPAQALSQMLAGTGLEFEFVNDRTVTVTRHGSRSSSTKSASAADVQVALLQDVPQNNENMQKLENSQETQKPSETPSGISEESTQEVTVTASRVTRAGFSAPTPTTVLTAEDLRAGGTTDIGEALIRLPAMRATQSPASFAGSIYGGIAAADVRGLGPFRTLVLVDGRRQTQSSTQGFNLNQVPFSIVKRVEVVTGGVSAAWGSDAVAGVVNVMIDDEFQGMGGDVQYGASSHGDGNEVKTSLAYGTRFAEDRGHFTLGAEYADNEGIAPRSARSYVANWGLIANPAFTTTNGQPRQIISPNVVYSVATPGGLITSGPLAGTQFLDGGVTAPFQYGSLRGTTFMVGGDPNAVQNNNFFALTAPVKRANALMRASYALTDALTLTADATWAYSKSDSHLIPAVNQGNIVIRSDNAFLPASIRTQMTTLGITQFNLGRVNTDIGSAHNIADFDTKQITLGANADLGGGWRWNTYYARGHNSFDEALSDLVVTARYTAAIDSVLGPGGQPVCRSTLTTPGNGCVPFNPFGPNASSEAARTYVSDTGRQNSSVDLDVAATSIQGEPFSTWAGPVSIAAGLEWRREELTNTVDPLSAARSFSLINFGALGGRTSVKEGFVEVVTPLLTDALFAKSLEFNGAVRVSDYSRSGTITSWKAGLTYDVTPEVRLRATRSRDIRAPSVQELFSPSLPSLITVLDPATNVQSQISSLSGGNPDLEPEKADTKTIGVVLQPDVMSPLRLSVDYYDIDIPGAITSVTAQNIVTQCAQGNQTLCARITRNSTGGIVSVSSPFLNVARLKTSGFDIETTYRSAGPFGGEVQWRVLANHVQSMLFTDGITPIDLAGNHGVSNNVAGVGGVPHWRFTAGAGYQRDEFSFDIQARYIGSGDYNNTLSIDDNTVESMVYVDLGAQYRLKHLGESDVTVYANVNNVFEPTPPKLPSGALYDLVGRYISFGVRAKY